MSRVVGKPLTHNQRKLLQSAGINDTAEWRYIKQETVSTDGKVSKTGPKTIYLVFQNNATNEVKKVAM